MLRNILLIVLLHAFAVIAALDLQFVLDSSIGNDTNCLADNSFPCATLVGLKEAVESFSNSTSFLNISIEISSDNRECSNVQLDMANITALYVSGPGSISCSSLTSVLSFVQSSADTDTVISMDSVVFSGYRLSFGMDSSDSIKISDSSILYAAAGCISVSSSSLTIENSEVSHCRITGSGAGIRATSTTLSAIDCSFRNNSATGNGGAVYITGATSRFVSSSNVFFLNYAGGTGTLASTSGGGAIYMDAGTTLQSWGDQILNCTTALRGGSVYLHLANGTVDNMYGFGNIATNTAPGFYLTDPSNLTLINSNFRWHQGTDLQAGSVISSFHWGSENWLGQIVVKNVSSEDNRGTFFSGPTNFYLEDVVAKRHTATLGGFVSPRTSGSMPIRGVLKRVTTEDMYVTSTGTVVMYQSDSFIPMTLTIEDSYFKTNSSNVVKTPYSLFEIAVGSALTMTNVTIDGCFSSAHEICNGCGRKDAATNSTLTDIKFIGGKLFKNAYVFQAGGSMSLKNSAFSNLITLSGVVLISDANFIGQNVSFFDNVGDSAVCLNLQGLVSTKSAIIEDCEFNTNLGQNLGGAITLNSNFGPISIRRSRFFGNIARNRGGAIEIIKSTMVDVENSEFVANRATSQQCGAIDVSDSIVSIKSSRFESNDGGRNGGCLYAAASTVNVRDSIFFKCTASNSGGAILARTASNLTIDECTFRECSSSLGGAFSLSGGKLDVHIWNSTLEKNTASQIGGAIHAENLEVFSSSIEIDSTIIAENIAEFDQAGGVFIYGPWMSTISEATFKENNALNEAGAILLSNGPVAMISNSNFVKNLGLSGSALFLLGNSTTVQIAETAFSENEAKSRGGSIFVSDSSQITISSSNFSMNTAESGGAIYSVNSDVYFQNGPSFFVKNAVESIGGCSDDSGKGGALYFSTPGRCPITNESSSITFSENSASLSGGAVFFTDCEVFTAESKGNFAKFGNSFSSEFSSMQLYSSNSISIYPGDTIEILLKPLDEFNNIILETNADVAVVATVSDSRISISPNNLIYFVDGVGVFQGKVTVSEEFASTLESTIEFQSQSALTSVRITLQECKFGYSLQKTDNSNSLSCQETTAVQSSNSTWMVVLWSIEILSAVALIMFLLRFRSDKVSRLMQMQSLICSAIGIILLLISQMTRIFNSDKTACGFQISFQELGIVLLTSPVIGEHFVVTKMIKRMKLYNAEVAAERKTASIISTSFFFCIQLLILIVFGSLVSTSCSRSDETRNAMTALLLAVRAVLFLSGLYITFSIRKLKNIVIFPLIGLIVTLSDYALSFTISMFSLIHFQVISFVLSFAFLELFLLSWLVVEYSLYTGAKSASPGSENFIQAKMDLLKNFDKEISEAIEDMKNLLTGSTVSNGSKISTASTAAVPITVQSASKGTSE